MKKIISITLIILALTSIGCGVLKQSPSGKVNKQEETKSKSVKPAGELVTKEFMINGFT